MIGRMYKKGLVVGIIVLFIGVGFQSSIAVDIPEKEEIEPKDYLFETIIEIANNPDVKDLLKEYEHCINFDYNSKYIFRQLLFRNPELLFTIIFSKPEITTQYLDKTYNQGIELVEIFGEEKAHEILDSVEITNPNLFDDLNNIIMKDEELSNRISTLEELNEYNDALCFILMIIILATAVNTAIYAQIADLFPENPILYSIFRTRALIGVLILITEINFFIDMGCAPPDPY
jgi:hypothetical protein